MTKQDFYHYTLHAIATWKCKCWRDCSCMFTIQDMAAEALEAKEQRTGDETV